MTNPALVIVLSLLGVLLVCVGGIVLLGRKRVASNMRDAGILPSWVRSPLAYTVCLGALQIVLGALLLAVAVRGQL